MPIYCSQSRQAIITIISPEKERILSKKPPVETLITDATNQRGDYVDYTHTMTAPINRSFDRDIHSVELNDSVNRWCYGTKGSVGENNPPNDLFTSCPTVGNAVVFGAEGLIIDGRRLHSNFDVDTSGRNAYFNNYGSCTYRVYFKNSLSYLLEINDLTGKIFSKTYKEEPRYEVACDDECPPGYCKCPTIKYPGYCCLSCKDVAARINNLAARIQ